MCNSFDLWSLIVHNVMLDSFFLFVCDFKRLECDILCFKFDKRMGCEWIVQARNEFDKNV